MLFCQWLGACSWSCWRRACLAAAGVWSVVGCLGQCCAALLASWRGTFANPAGLALHVPAVALQLLGCS
jgi:hypothetical protein